MKYILFKNNEMLGYLDSETEVKQAISDLADSIIANLSNSDTPTTEKTRIFRENIESGINIYTQVLGAFINGAVYLQDVLYWKQISQYK